MKVAKKYITADPWKIIEDGFYPEHSEVSESLFSLGNEYMGARGYFEEGFSGKSLRGCFFNGIFENEHIGHPHWFKGIVTEGHFMVNSADWLYTKIVIDGERLDLLNSDFKNYQRSLNLKTGMLERQFTWILNSGKEIDLCFQRFVSMKNKSIAGQQIKFLSKSFAGKIEVQTGIDFSTVHEAHGQCFWESHKAGKYDDVYYILGNTLETKQRLCSSFILQGCEQFIKEVRENSGSLVVDLELDVELGEEVCLKKLISNHTEKDVKLDDEQVILSACRTLNLSERKTYSAYLNESQHFWDKFWETGDIEIEGDIDNQQGIRFCIFHLTQTYHGVSPEYGISAKGLTGEVYSGWTWWDTETYCLPFYLFSLPEAAKNLLLYRHRTLPQALERAKQLDCEGARYPMATINGKEAVGTWQHGDLEIHVSAAVAYGIWHYVKLTDDEEFLFNEGIEMLLQICRYYASRGQWGQLTGEFGFFGVMGPDEFAMMVHNNYYTNAMAKKTFEYTLSVVNVMKKTAVEKLRKVTRKIGLSEDECKDWKNKAQKMRIFSDPQTGVYEQYDGYFNMPHIDTDKIPDSEFPLYKHWAYVRIFRNDMLKQPDVLLMHLFYSNDYSLENKRANFDFYEKRCSHESSLSPGIHSILASELGRNEKAFDYARYASRLDLDNYNNNTHEGIHNTSMAAAWMNITYGFAGLRTDGNVLSFNPSIPKKWRKYSFKLKYRNAIICISVDKQNITMNLEKGAELNITVYGKMQSITQHTKIMLLKNEEY